MASKEDSKSEGKKSSVLEGAEELLTEWGYALNMMAFSSREGFNSFREIERDAATHWFQRIIGKLPKTKTAYEAAVKFRDLADERRVILKGNFKLEEKGDTILGTFLSHDCPYKKCCIARRREGKDYVCFRAAPFVNAVRLMSGKEYRADVFYEQTEPGKACILRGVPTELAFKVGLSYKLSKGTVKVHELDCKKVGIGMVDTVTVMPSRKEISGRKINAMSYSQAKYPPGMILMNIADAKSLGLGEKDTVFVKKAGEGAEVSLVGEEEYEAKSGEYETPEVKEESGEEEKAGKTESEAGKEKTAPEGEEAKETEKGAEPEKAKPKEAVRSGEEKEAKPAEAEEKAPKEKPPAKREEPVITQSEEELEKPAMPQEEPKKEEKKPEGGEAKETEKGAEPEKAKAEKKKAKPRKPKKAKKRAVYGHKEAEKKELESKIDNIRQKT